MQDNTLTFTVAHNGSAPYDLLLNGALQDYPGFCRHGGGKAGPGLMVMSGTNTYIGPTTVTAGTLAVNGRLTAPAVTVKRRRAQRHGQRRQPRSTSPAAAP